MQGSSRLRLVLCSLAAPLALACEGPLPDETSEVEMHQRAVVIPGKGTTSTLDVASWNIEWFGDTNNGPGNETLQLQNARDVISGTDFDVWGVAEIVSNSQWNSLREPAARIHRISGQREPRRERTGLLQRLQRHGTEGRHPLQERAGLAAGRAGHPHRERLRLRRPAAPAGHVAGHPQRHHRGHPRHRAPRQMLQRRRQLAATSERLERPQVLPGRELPDPEGMGDRRFQRRPGHLDHPGAHLPLRELRQRHGGLQVPEQGPVGRGHLLDRRFFRHHRPPSEHQRQQRGLRRRLGRGVPGRSVHQQLRRDHQRSLPRAQSIQLGRGRWRKRAGDPQRDPGQRARQQHRRRGHRDRQRGRGQRQHRGVDVVGRQLRCATPSPPGPPWRRARPWWCSPARRPYRAGWRTRWPPPRGA